MSLSTPLRCLALLVVLVTSVARGDDTEIFVAPADTDSAGGRSNILIIIDTSASMESEVQTQAPWNPGSTYTGCYRSDVIYFGTGTQLPPCGSAAFVAKSANGCAASRGAFDSLGQYGGYALGWDAARERWDPLVEDDESRPLECQDDRGIDGQGSERYAANGPDGPWGPDTSQEPAWNTQYTLFDGNWLNWRANPPTVTRTRLQIVQEVVNDIVVNLDDVNVGLMEFNREDGGHMSQPVVNIETSRGALTTAVSNMVTQGRTPLSETLYEATLYFRGNRVDYGNISPTLSVPSSRTADGINYLTPVTAECQRNFIVLLTDGEPLGDVSANAKIRSLPGFAGLIGNCDGTGEGACLDDLAEYLLRSDLSSALPGAQNVVTYTIGFGVDSPLLESTAQRGGGQYYVAEDTGSLAAVMTEVVAGIAERGATFSAPSVPVSAYGSAAAEREAYVAVFQPTGTAHWPGNLKKYLVVDGELVGQDGDEAVDPTSGFFADDAFSFWSAEPDGERVREGGAASRLPTVGTRRLFTDLSPGALTTSANSVEVGNAGLTAGVLGVGPTERDRLIQWIRGSDVTDLDRDGNTMEQRLEMGDPLHVRPVVLSYGATADSADTTVFIATNDGFLHAIDAETGDERWAYLPSRLLARQNEFLLNAQTATRRYGLDGELRLAILREDGVVDTPGIGSGEQAVLYFGMGRGGDAVFAVDVSDPEDPELLWQIDRTTTGFGSIGQTWAAPEVARINVGGTNRDVVILSGGYDDSQDNRGYRTDAVGNAIYIVDALTGERIWSAGAPDVGHTLELPAMQHSIPAAPRVIDLTGDGIADRLYVGDMGGRLWRFDIRNGNPRNSLGDGGVLASLGAADLDAPPPADVRRFYATPDAVLVDCLRGTFLAINIGSGYRGHPLDTDVQDAMFSVRDPNAFGALNTADYLPPIEVADLLDITTDPNADVPPDEAGWMLRLVEDPGEKALSTPLTFDGTLFFTTFAPGGNVSACVGGLGLNRLYAVDACNGNAVTNLDGSAEGPLTVQDRFIMLNQTGIAPPPVFIFSPTDPPIVCVGTECQPPDNGILDGSSTLKRTYWTQENAQ